MTTAVAVDAGGTSTRALVVAADGTCLAEVRLGPGNPRSAPDAARTVAACTRQAADAAGVEPEVVVVTMAGLISLGGVYPPGEAALREAGFSRARFVSDMLGIYCSATDAAVGSVLLAGTGTTAAAFREGHLVAMRDGLGWLLGDGGAGFWLGRRVARAVAAELDHRGPATSLTPRVLELMPPAPPAHPHDDRLAALLAWTYGQRPVDLARLAVLATQEAGRDTVATRLCDEATDILLDTLAALPGSGDGPVVLGGSVLGPESVIGQQVASRLGGLALRASDGIVGAAVLALRDLAITGDVRPRILSTRSPIH